MADFRSDPMPSTEGRGIARSAWEAYGGGVQRATETTLAKPIRQYGIGVMEDLVGVWVMWHALGGFEGLQEFGMSRATIFRRINAFRKYFGEHPDEYKFPGIAFNLDEMHDTRWSHSCDRVIRDRRSHLCDCRSVSVVEVACATTFRIRIGSRSI